MDPVRQLCVWLGVGAGHAALLVALWGSGGVSEQASTDGCVVVWLLPAVGDETPVVVPSRANPPAALASSPRPASTTPRAHPIAGVSPGPAPATGESPETVGLPPVFVERVEPHYPRAARLAGVQGVVRLGLEVSAGGALRRVSVVASSGDALLDRAAVEAARASVYGPATVSGRAVDAEVEATYRFELR